MASPRRRRLRKLLRAGLLKTAGAVEAAAEAVAPAEEAPAPLVEAPVVKETPDTDQVPFSLGLSGVLPFNIGSTVSKSAYTMTKGKQVSTE